MVVCLKKNGKPHTTVEVQALNLHTTRETHHTQSPFHQAWSIPHGTRKTIFNAWNRYHSVPLHPNDRHLTTFIPPWGRYHYCTAPQGYLAIGDGYTHRYDEIIADILQKTKCIDDTLLWSNSIEESFWQVVNWLDICGHNGIILHKDKFVFASDTVEFAGFQIGPDSVSPCPRYLKAILDFPTPKSITDACSWFGLLNQVSYTFSMGTHMQPFRQLLKPGTKFVWNDHLNNHFKESKRAIVKEIEEGVCIFDPAKPTCLATDWSKTHIGFWLFQKHCQCPGLKPFYCHDGWKIILVGSCFTHPAESRYAPIEGEALAVTYGLDSARFFVLGCPTLIVGVDHKPLLRIFRDRAPDDIDNTHLWNLKERTLHYHFQVTHIPVIKHKAVDATSRHPVSEAIKLLLPDDVAFLEDISDPSSHKEHCLAFLNAISIAVTSPPYDDHESSLQHFTVAAINSLQSVTWTRVHLATAGNDDMNQLLSIIASGMPESHHQLPPPPNLQEYFQFRAHLSTIDGVITYKDRTVIPPCLEILSYQHCIQHTAVSVLCLPMPNHLFSGLASHLPSTPPNKTAATVTTWHHPNPVHHPHLQCHLCTPSNVSAVTSSPIKAPHTSFMLIGTLTGLLLNAHRMEQRDWSTASSMPSSLMAYQKNWPQMVDQNSNQTPSKASCAHGESTIGYHPSPSHTATVGLK